jgi:ribonuclease D
MSHDNITTERELIEYCERLAGAKQIALDTEFVSERTYRPVLCLVQVIADGQPALIDPLTLADMTPFWRALAAPGHETIVHAGRGELEFCLHATGSPPAGLLDVQIAAGLVGLEYPAGAGTLVSRLLGKSSKKEETRTDWRRRPLSPRQIDYALEDIRHLPAMRDLLTARLEQLGRLSWLDEEMAAWQEEVRSAVFQERWRRVSGNAGLSRRGLAVLRELWRWREAEAQRRDCPIRRVLRDDLLVEMARRQTADVKRIQALRGLERGDLKRQLPKIAEAIQRGLDLAEDECPRSASRESPPHLSVLGQFLFSALGSICRQIDLAPGLVGTPSDVRDWIVFRTGQMPAGRTPRLAQGWRATVIGKVFDDLMAGKLSVRIGDPDSAHPLRLEPAEGDEGVRG